MSRRCPYWDCGWCYSQSPDTNSQGGACQGSKDCTEYKKEARKGSKHPVDSERKSGQG